MSASLASTIATFVDILLPPEEKRHANKQGASSTPEWRGCSGAAPSVATFTASIIDDHCHTVMLTTFSKTVTSLRSAI
jgi:hypothetical protein